MPGQIPIRCTMVSVLAIRGDDTETRVLLLRRAGNHLRGIWSYVAGHIEAGETAWQAARRELSEETGLLIGTAGDSDMVGYDRAGLMPDASALHYVFRAITPPGRPRRFDARFFLADAAAVTGDLNDFSRACDELSHLHWVPMAEARDLHLPFITEVVLAEAAAMVAAAGSGPIRAPDNVPFFDNRDARSRFVQIGADG